MIVAKKAGQHRTDVKQLRHSEDQCQSITMPKKGMHNTQPDDQLLVSQLQDVLKLDST